MKVLMLLDHATDYREKFLRELSKKCDLTVTADSPENDNLKNNLKSPTERIGYRYFEFSKTFGKNIRINLELNKYIKTIRPDIVCVALNIRYPMRVIDFFLQKNKPYKWVWWGQIFGSIDKYLPGLRFFKKQLVRQSDGTLVYTEEIKEKLSDSNVLSFNNSQFSKNEFHELENTFNKKLHCLFVGRPQVRKRLDLIFEIAKRRQDVKFRLVGPNMDSFFNSKSLPANVDLYPAAYGETLKDHFKWSNLVVNPGHVGLLVMNAAAHNRPIAIGENVNHAPEVLLAKESNQFFLDFENDAVVDGFVDKVQKNPSLLKRKGDLNFKIAIENYTIEKMVERHMQMFNKVLLQ